jgi:NAD(P)-dependent dehydrogenase (short-subunit alcohol dehydrogenase family)
LHERVSDPPRPTPRLSRPRREGFSNSQRKCSDVSGSLDVGANIFTCNAGVTNNPDETIAEVATEEFVRVMVTNALSPMRVVETLFDLVAVDGMIGVMSSGQGSVSNNTIGKREVYRGSKAALNMFMRSYAARHAGEARSLVLMAPGWIRTALGGPDAPLGIEDAIPKVVEVLLSQHGKPGLKYLDRFGAPVPW